MIMEGKEADAANFKRLQEALGFLEFWLEESQYVTGSEPTIGDFAIVASISAFDAAGIDLKAYPNISR